jgi:hypothetical protein
MDLKDKIAVVTGATGGIGRELTKELADKGVKVIAVARTEEKLKELQKEISGEGHLFFASDFTQTSEIEKLIKQITSGVEKIDILVNAAGVGVYKNVEDVDLKEWTDSLAINATAPFFMTKLLLPLLKKSEKSVIINVGSGMGKMAVACRSVYCATKYALRGMTLSLAAEFKGTNVNFVHIALGSTLTEFGPMTLKEKEEENLNGKSYFTPTWVAKKFVEIIENEQFEDEIELYPSDYAGKENEIS